MGVIFTPPSKPRTEFDEAFVGVLLGEGLYPSGRVRLVIPPAAEDVTFGMGGKEGSFESAV
jgi:hypothetical protein